LELARRLSTAVDALPGDDVHDFDDATTDLGLDLTAFAASTIGKRPRVPSPPSASARRRPPSSTVSARRSTVGARCGSNSNPWAPSRRPTSSATPRSPFRASGRVTSTTMPVATPCSCSRSSRVSGCARTGGSPPGTRRWRRTRACGGSWSGGSSGCRPTPSRCCTRWHSSLRNARSRWPRPSRAGPRRSPPAASPSSRRSGSSMAFTWCTTWCGTWWSRTCRTPSGACHTWEPPARTSRWARIPRSSPRTCTPRGRAARRAALVAAGRRRVPRRQPGRRPGPCSGAPGVAGRLAARRHGGPAAGRRRRGGPAAGWRRRGGPAAGWRRRV